MSLLSVFLSAPLFTVLAGRREIGSVDESSFLDGSGKTEAKVLLLGGSAWRVTHIDWTKRLVFVEPSDNQGKSRWRSQPPGLRFDLSQSIFQVLTDATDRPWWSQRAKTTLQVLRAEFSELQQGSTLLEHSRQGFTWWTFAGAGANASLAPTIAAATGLEPRVESFCIRFKGESTTKALSEAIDTARAMPMDQLRPTIDPDALQGLKFSSCLPDGRGERILEERLREERGIRYLKDSPVRIVAMV